jgi:hypothetical protein
VSAKANRPQPIGPPASTRRDGVVADIAKGPVGLHHLQRGRPGLTRMVSGIEGPVTNSQPSSNGSATGRSNMEGPHNTTTIQKINTLLCGKGTAPHGDRERQCARKNHGFATSLISVVMSGRSIGTTFSTAMPDRLSTTMLHVPTAESGLRSPCHE